MKNSLLTHSIVIVIALLIGAWVGHEWQEKSYAHAEQIFSKGGGGLTNPLLECGVETGEVSIGERAAIEDEVSAYVESTLKRGLITHVAVYFRDLNNGPWFGIDERTQFEPGSLLKLPIAMSFYYWDQRHRGVLESTIDLTDPKSQERFVVSNNADPSQKRIEPSVYTVRDLIGIMLRDSSNVAADVLAEYEGRERMQKIFMDLGIEPPVPGGNYTTDVKTYGAFFRVLYNASYIGEVDSEELLTTLTQSTFRDGLVRGVPASVKVAHKYGTRIVGEGGHRQLHDCGIVYSEKTPYVLCIMTQGESMKKLESTIADISKIVYDGVAVP